MDVRATAPQHFRGSELQNYFTKLLEDELKAIIKPQYVDHIPRAVKGTVGAVSPTQHVAIPYPVYLHVCTSVLPSADPSACLPGSLPACILAASLFRMWLDYVRVRG